MTDKKKKLILYLMEQQLPCPSSELAKLLDVSVRTVKTYIKDINMMTDKKIIHSFSKGYLINKQDALSFLDEDNSLPQNYLERAYYIIKKILVEHKNPNVLDLCDELFVGYSTLKADLTKMNNTFQKFNIRFYTQNEILHINGAEKDKRSLLSSVIFEETNNRIIDTNTLKQSFAEEDIGKITNIINEFFLKNNYYLNNFAYMNLLLHFSILIDRVKKGFYLSDFRNILTDSSEDMELIEKISKRIERDFSINLNTYERNEIYILFKTNVNYLVDANSNFNQLKNIVGPEALKIVHEIIDEVSDLYSIDLKHESFFIPFGLHIKSLVTRASLKKYNKNPLLENIKRDCPIIYDISIFVSLRLAEIYNIKINEDEIAFIAIHIGTEIDRQKTATDKLKCILLCPDYLGLKTNIYNQILHEFSNDIDLMAEISNFEELETYTFDLLITVIDDQRKNYYQSVLISPFQFDSQKKEIHGKIHEIQQLRKKGIILDNFERYFNENLFFKMEDISKEEVIERICNKMVNLGFVQHSFKSDVFERENASSTSFGQIAIPHSVHMNALQTSIGVAISRRGITWGDNIVHVVLLIAINKLDKQIFLKIYESILSLFENENVFEMMKCASTLSDFKDTVFTNI
ncbi:transcriptional antiterminator [Pullulanibacillus camelliae]|uniref:Transcriptional antiterminator n=1 Tax=Pullulanibacillus camelliae TaxID=1707096 RepID=A0A8J2YNB3_9BACL|nr:PTS sugar transporter subunit IIA [Pullulanibacillus camelliae]GGE54911.1 transcriptional antiterminator [Pullulanibacillus camelliae]